MSSIKARIERLEHLAARSGPKETVTRVRVVVVHTREEVEQLRAAGILDSREDYSRPPPPGPVRLVIREASVQEVLGIAPAAPPQSELA